MSVPLFWNQGSTAALVNHLWQSTAVVGIACLLAVALRKNHARVRYWVWFAASVKFLLPFSLLIAAGKWIQSLPAVSVIHKPVVAATIVQFVQPLSPTEAIDQSAAPIIVHASSWLPIALLVIWFFGVLLVGARFARAWWSAHAAKRAATPHALAADVPVLCTPAPMEPGVFGIFRPVLLLPEGILERLSAGQLRAIVAHEMCHVRRHDNLTFAVHQVVTAMFWFHPAVWWIRIQLIEERERACDEAVVRASGAAETYAEGILNVCRFYFESPAACVAGVTGADLKQRIVRIMTGQTARNLSLSRKLLLGACCAVAVVVPVVAGLAWAGQKPAQEQEAGMAHLPQFDVVSIKPHKDEGMRMRIGMMVTPDGFSGNGLPLDLLLRNAFDLPRDRILNEPEWAKSRRYDIEAKVAPDDAPKLKKLSRQQRWAMLIPVLQERCGLKFHHETKELEVYTLVVAKGGPKLKEATPDELAANGPPPAPEKPGAAGGLGKGQMMMHMSPQGMVLEATASTMAGFTRILSQQIGSTVVDKTGLTGSYDFTLSFMPEEGGGPVMAPGKGAPPPDGGGQTQEPVGPSIFTALQEQLGLKLVAQKQQVDVIVIDHVEQPSPN
ncbi:MAG: M56 family metallopeptidase [Terracidiphilus sp.]